MKLLEAVHIPPLPALRNRVVMSAMTRNFAPNHLVTEAMVDYYGRRAENEVGLILTEGVIIDRSGDGYRDVPYIATSEQAESWRPVLDRVHAAGGRILCQLWHCGRISHSDFTGGVPPVSSTSRPAEGMNRQNDKAFGEPRALEVSEMSAVYDMFAQAARRALTVGFDGVELHFGHGYLVDQFFDGSVNDRTDAYGGSIAGRCRFGLELLERVLSHVSAERVMVRISPSREMNGIHEWPDMEEMLEYMVPRFSEMGLRMLDVSCARSDYFATSGKVIRMVRRLWPHVLLGGASLSIDQAEQEVQSGLLDLVTWGRHILANPDFVPRMRENQPLRPFDRAMLSSLD